MGLEAVTFISDFNTSWPLSTDKRRQGDDHLRAIKLGVKNTFPNITGPVTATQAQLNSIPESFTEILAEILLHLEPAGSIKQWDLVNKPTLPPGWVECMGQTVSGYGTVPDMRDKFIVGRGSTYTHGTTGGNDSVASSASGGHTPVIEGTALTSAHIPAHDHALYVFETGSSSDANNFGTTNSKGLAGNTDGTYAYRTTTTVTAGAQKLVQNTGAAATAHGHTASAVADHTHTVATIPPYYTSIFIVKVTEYEAP